MDIRKIRKIIDLMREKGVGEMEIQEGEESVRISQVAGTVPQVTTYPTHFSAQEIIPAPTITTTITTPKHQPDKKNTINSPMVGIFYLSSSPGSTPFVEIGKRIKAGDVLCIVEAMKMFNQIESDRGGIITAILAENGQPVEYDQPLFTIED